MFNDAFALDSPVISGMVKKVSIHLGRETGSYYERVVEKSIPQISGQPSLTKIFVFKVWVKMTVNLVGG